MLKFDLPQDPKLAIKVLDAHAQQASRKMEIGFMGWLLGDAMNKPGNLAGLAIIMACVMIALVAYAPLPADVSKREVITAFIAVISAALGYAFGNAAKSSG